MFPGLLPELLVTGSSSRLMRLVALAFAAPFLAVLTLFEVIPFGLIAGKSLMAADGSWTWANYAELLASRFQRKAFYNSLLLSSSTAAIGVGLGLPFAVLVRRASPGLRQLVLNTANLCANFTGFPIAFAFIIMFGYSGAFTLALVKSGLVAQFDIYSMPGLVLVFSYFQIPLGLLLIFPTLGALTPEIEDASRLMGIGPVRFWWRVGLPILLPSLIGSFVLLFANAMGTYATALALVGGNANLVTIRIGELVTGDLFSEPGLANALSMLLVLSLAVPIIAEQWFRRRRLAP